jgi:hypothetical protein
MNKAAEHARRRRRLKWWCLLVVVQNPYLKVYYKIILTRVFLGSHYSCYCAWRGPWGWIGKDSNKCGDWSLRM